MYVTAIQFASGTLPVSYPSGDLSELTGEESLLNLGASEAGYVCIATGKVLFDTPRFSVY